MKGDTGNREEIKKKGTGRIHCYTILFFQLLLFADNCVNRIWTEKKRTLSVKEEYNRKSTLY